MDTKYNRGNRSRMWMTLTVLSMVLSMLLTACGGSKGGSEAQKSGDNTVAGIYTASYPMRDAINDELEAAGIELQSEINADFDLDLKEDGTFSLDVDTESLIASMTNALTGELDQIIDQLLSDQGVTEDMYEEIAKAGGYSSFDGLRDEMKKNMLNELDKSALDDLASACHLDGTYTVRKSKLKLADTGDGTISIESAKIMDDGSIVVKSKADKKEVELTFSRQ